MLPDSATQSSNHIFSKLLALVSENSPLLSQCLEQLNHVSHCHKLEGECTFPLCLTIKRDVYRIRMCLTRSYHTSNCTDENCPTCLLMRPLILFHSMNCKEEGCQIILCSVRFPSPLHPSATTRPGQCSSTA